jgi:hypothetical protein
LLVVLVLQKYSYIILSFTKLYKCTPIEKITLKQKKLKDNISLFIEYYNGSTINSNGKRIHNRRLEYLKLYLHRAPSAPKEKKENKENLELAENIYGIRKAEYLQGKFKIQDRSKNKQQFLQFYILKKEERFQSDKNYDNWEAAQKHIEKFCPPNITFDEINIDFVKNFQKFLHITAIAKSGYPLSKYKTYLLQ